MKKGDKVFIKAVVERPAEKGSRMVRVYTGTNNTPVWVSLSEIAQIPDLRAYLDRIDQLKEDFDHSRAAALKGYKDRLDEVPDQKQKEALGVRK